MSTAQDNRPTLGMGLNGIADWTTQQPFLDIAKTGRTWLGHTEDNWGEWQMSEFLKSGVLDDQGWLTAMPEGLQAAEMLMLTEQAPGAVSLSGRYRLRYDGQGQLAVNNAEGEVVYSPGEVYFDYSAGGPIIGIIITETDPRDPIRNITVVHERNIPAFDSGEIFNPLWLDLIDDLDAVRFMDWMSTNNSPVSGWETRPRIDDFTYTYRGVPLEVMIALANETGIDPWFTIPHLATSEYTRRFAEMVRDTLDPSLTAYIEFSNEVWNWQFGQAQWAHAQGQARWPDEGDAWVQYYAMKATEIALIFDEVFGNQADQRLIKVISSQTGWLGLEEGILNAPLWVNEDPANRAAPSTYFDAYAITGYFSGRLGEDDKVGTLRDWLAESLQIAEDEADSTGLSGTERDDYIAAHRFDTAVTRAAAELRDGSETGDARDSLADYLGRTLPYHAAVAQNAGLDLIMYEGGTHVVGIGENTSDDDLMMFFMHLNYTEEMGALYETLLQGWADGGGGLFMAFVDLGQPGRWGSWGALRYLEDSNPRWDALMAFSERYPAR